jgi:DNA-directed RNA polymerase specialized sigma24 family protein
MVPPSRKQGRFATTHWSVVAAAGDTKDPRAREALTSICETYWPPVYGFIRSRGYGVEQAKDLTQGFFAALLEKNYLKIARRDKGRFRSFLLTCTKRFLGDEQDRETAAKRGGGRVAVPFDVGTIEAAHGAGDMAGADPERVFEKRWAQTVMEQVMAQLESEAARSGNLERFRRLRPMIDGTSRASYKQLSEELDASETSLKVAVHRLRRRFGQLLRQEVARTITERENVDDEVRHVLAALSF